MSRHLLTRTKLWPGEPGTKALVEAYGERLICVRYLYDPQRRMRYTTAEIVIREGPWRPRPHTPGAQVGVRVQWGEAGLAHRIKVAGGAWDRQAKVWRLAYATAVQLGVTDRLVPLPPAPTRSRRPVSAGQEEPTNG